MDFFRSCRTNVQVCNKIDDVQYAVHTTSEEGRAERSKLARVLATLREQGTLCTRVEHELWVFGDIGEDSRNFLGDPGIGLDRVEEGSLEDDDAPVQAADGTDLRDVFLDSIAGAVSYRLCKACGVLRRGPRVWAFDGEEAAESWLLRLHMRVIETGHGGALYATITTERNGRTPVNAENGLEGKEVILGPTGAEAVFTSEPAGAIATDEWKAAVTADLATEGIGPPAEDMWKLVRLPSGQRVVWPLDLCFLPLHPSKTRQVLPGDSEDWKYLFTGPENSHGFKHPLTFAEEWFAGKDERERAARDALRTPANHGAGDGTSLQATGSALDGTVVTSPPFVQRTADQQATMAGIYPTPEDNLMPPSASQQPSSDNVPTSVPADSTNVGAELMTMGDAPQLRGQTSSSDPPAFHAGHDDLFGDIGAEMDFGGGEVGDADFDFFNEEAEVEAAPDVGEDVAMMDGVNEIPETPAPVPEDQQANNTSEQAMRDPDAKDTDARDDSRATATAPFNGNGRLENAAPGPIEERNGYNEELLQDQANREPEKPLSPFGIKERLLPPPVPASAKPASERFVSDQQRRRSTFEPITFKEGLELDSRYSMSTHPPGNHRADDPGSISISLPPKRKKPLLKRPPDKDSEASDDNSESEEDSFESASSATDENYPPKVPWNDKKRKRGELDTDASANDISQLWVQETQEDGKEPTEEQILGVLQQVFRSPEADAVRHNGRTYLLPLDAADKLPPVEELAEFSKLDLVYIAQLISEQAVSCLPSMVRDLDNLAIEDRDKATPASLQRFAQQAINGVLPDTMTCDIAKLALARETQRSAPGPNQPRPGQPRPPPQRFDGMPPGPDLANIQPPHIRVQRGNDAYEMLPPALEFWETLSLAPCNGPKDVRAFCVFPSNEDLQRLVDTFMSELGGAYEGSKLGTHVHIRNINEENDLDDFEDGLAPVQLDEESDVTLEAALRQYHATCSDLGMFLASFGHLETERDRTIVVYMVDCFPHNAKITQHLCSCFWRVCKTYRENTPKTSRHQPKCDVVLQILPIELVASAETLVCLDAKQLSALAKEVYDRCPPSTANEQDVTSALPNYVAPFVELASPPPKRIGFQLTAEPPSDLLHEASSLHLAYVVSKDGKWMTAAWTDSTGRYQSSVSLCLCGKSFAEVAEDVWDRTRDLLAAREVSWRVAIVTTGDMEDSIRRCWRKVIEKPRKQAYSVTLISADENPNLELTPPGGTEEGVGIGGIGGAAGFLTPVGTPSGAAMTVSPDASGHAAPPTPAPSETTSAATAATAAAENDPDAHLIDHTDESWAVLFSPSYTESSCPPGTLSSGALFKRGEAGLPDYSDLPASSAAHLPCLKLSVLWTVQVRPNGNVDEGGPKHAEMTLREVLKMYRNLSVLTRARGLDREIKGNGGVVPVHLVAASRGAERLEGFLP
jgi:mediator of RNA polymerase II transcription subunit 13, fungi type